MSTSTVIEPIADADWFLPAPEPGMYSGVAFEEYVRWAAMNYSTLCHMEKSPLHVRYAMLTPSKEESKAQALGHAAHAAVLEPDRFAAAFAVMPYFGKRQSSTVRAEEDAFRKAHPETTYIDKPEYDCCIKMRDAVYGHTTAAALLRAPGFNEVSSSWIDKVTGLPCKGRQDRVGEWHRPYVADVKTAEDASRGVFSRAMSKYGYAEQAPFYLDGLNTILPAAEQRPYYFIVVEKDPPYAVAVYELDTASIEVGRRKIRGYLNRYASCLESGVWEGYGDGADLLSLPAYDLKEQEHY